MTPENLRALLRDGETLAVEFKGETREPLNDRDLVQAVICLANRVGKEPGYLLVGVEDDGQITGARPRHEAGVTDPQRVQALIANRTRPSLTCRAELVTLPEGTVLVVEIPVAHIPVGTTEGLYVRRAIGARGRPACLPFHFHEMQALQADRGVLDYSALSLPEAQWQDLDPLEFARFRRSIRESEGLGDSSLLNLSDLELAKALGAVEANHEVTVIRVLGLLLFGHEASLRRFLPSHEVAFQALADTRVEVNDFFRWPLLRVMDEILTRLRARNREEELIVGMVRVGVPDYSRRAFREGVANALIHRDYTSLGTVHIQWHRDRLEITSPGGFLPGIRLDNLLVAGPKPRNPLLADAFKRAGIVERTARGIDMIFYDQLRNGRPAPSYERSTAYSVTVVLPSGKADLDFVRLIVEESQAGRTLGLDELLVLSTLRNEGQLALPHAAQLIQKSEMDAQRVLLPLTEAGLVVTRRQRQEMVYELSAATLHRLGAPRTRTGIREIDRLRECEQRVLDYVSRHGRITRRETAILCEITDRQARALLERLVRERRLVRRGEGRGSFYGRRPKKTDASDS